MVFKFKMGKKVKKGDFLRRINAKNEQFFLGPGSTESYMCTAPSELEKSSERWRIIAKNLEDMSVGQFCMVAGTDIEGDPYREKVESYRDRLTESLIAMRKENRVPGNVEEDYRFEILHDDNYHRLKVRRK